MSQATNIISDWSPEQKEVALFLHDWFTEELGLTDRITFDNPCYYGKSWICYLRPSPKNKVELAFLRGNELSNEQGLLESKGRKQLMSVEFARAREIPMKTLREILNEAILLDESVPYQSKRKKS